MPRNASAFGWEKPVEGETNDWLTPPGFVRLLGPFDLDPCGVPAEFPWCGTRSAYWPKGDECEMTHESEKKTRPWDLAARTIALPEDGLKAEWAGLVWCNPPYGRHVGAWVGKMASHGNGMMLIFARTDTRAVQQLLRTASGVFFPAGRLLFYRPDGTRSEGKAAPSLLASFGQEARSRLGALRLRGAMLEVRGTQDGPPTVDDMV